VDSTLYRRGADGRHVPVLTEGTAGPGRDRLEFPRDEFDELFEVSGQPEVPAIAAPQVMPIPKLKEPKIKVPKMRLTKTADEALDESQLTKLEQPTKSPRNRTLTRVIRTLKVGLVAYILFFAWLAFDTSHALEKTKAMPHRRIANTAGTNWLLVGSDSRRGLSFQDMKALRTGMDNSSQRTDTIMVVHFGGKGRASLISLPRDSYVVIPRHMYNGRVVNEYHNKINATYSIGGAPLLVATVERNTGLHIDHYMEVGFAGIRDLTDAIGGVDMCVPRHYVDKNSGLNIGKGCQTLDGKTALAYVRMRYADPRGDIGRIQRQQQYLGAVLHKVATPGVLLNPISMRRLSKATTGALVLGKDDGVTDLGRLGIAMRSLMKGKGAVKTVPVATASGFVGGQSVVLWNEQQAKALFSSLGAK
jgi:LCP family protein required for cell wall assembly